MTVYSITDLGDLINEKIAVFPNPTTSNLSIDFGKPVDLPVRFKLINSSGQAVDQFTIEKDQQFTEIDLSYLPSGIYLLKAISDESRLNWKIVKK